MKLSLEYKSDDSNITWDAMSGLKNRIVHDY
ncbi:HepT-like ribonuclease domain-containing protein [Butyrivibrio sp. NC3005]